MNADITLSSADLQINKNLAEKKTNTTTNEADRCAHNKPKLSQAVSLKKHFPLTRPKGRLQQVTLSFPTNSICIVISIAHRLNLPFS